VSRASHGSAFSQGARLSRSRGLRFDAFPFVIGARGNRSAGDRSADIAKWPETNCLDVSNRTQKISTTAIVATAIAKNPPPIHCRKLTPSVAFDVSFARSW